MMEKIDEIQTPSTPAAPLHVHGRRVFTIWVLLYWTLSSIAVAIPVASGTAIVVWGNMYLWGFDKCSPETRSFFDRADFCHLGIVIIAIVDLIVGLIVVSTAFVYGSRAWDHIKLKAGK